MLVRFRFVVGRIIIQLVTSVHFQDASFQLGVFVIECCSQVLQPVVCRFLNCCILDRDGLNSELKDSYHAVIYEILKCAPEMLIAVLPNLTQELLFSLSLSLSLCGFFKIKLPFSIFILIQFLFLVIYRLIWLMFESIVVLCK